VWFAIAAALSRLPPLLRYAVIAFARKLYPGGAALTPR
jgi:hypothetical protein